MTPSISATSPTLPLDLLGILTLLGAAPFVILMTTSYVRIIVVLSLVRSAIGASSVPPNAVLHGLALALTFTVMTPTLHAVAHEAIDPYRHGSIGPAQALERGYGPLQAFMLRQTHPRDLRLFARVAHEEGRRAGQLTPDVLIPAYVVGQLRDAFAMGIALYLPFVAIDLAVSAILMGMGMFMLSPPVVSLPCKLLLFVVVDGWSLLCGSLASSFR